MPGPFTHPWTTPVPLNEAASSQGNCYGNVMQRIIDGGYRYASVNTNKYAPAVYQVPATQPRVAVKMWNCQNKKRFPDVNFEQQMMDVPIPPGAEVPPDSDAHIAVWQPATDTVWELWKARKAARPGQTPSWGWEACWGGRMSSASTSYGAFPFPYGGTASGISLLAGLITAEDLASGTIAHALAVGVDNVAQGVYSWPANRCDGKSTLSDAIPEGQRLRLDPAVDVDSLHLSPLGTMVARALQIYGCIVRDRTLGSVSFYAQRLPRAAGQPDPYAKYYGGRAKYEQLDGIPWTELVALPIDYGALPLNDGTPR